MCLATRVSVRISLPVAREHTSKGERGTGTGTVTNLPALGVFWLWAY